MNLVGVFYFQQCPSVRQSWTYIEQRIFHQQDATPVLKIIRSVSLVRAPEA